MTGLGYYSQQFVVSGYFSTMNGIYAEYAPITSIIKQLQCQREAPYFSPDSVAIDLGCGPGNSLIHLVAALKVRNIIAIDGSQPMLDFISEHIVTFLPEATIQTMRADLQTEKIAVESSSIAVATCASVSYYLKSVENVISETARMLIPGGYFGFNVELHEAPVGTLHSIEDNLDCYVHSKHAVLQMFADLGLTPILTGSLDFSPIENIPTKTYNFILRKKS